MKRENQYEQWFQHEENLPPSLDDRLQKTYQMLPDRCQTAAGKGKKRVWRTAAAVIAAAVVLTTAAIAAVNHGGFFQSVFGTSVGSIPEQADTGSGYMLPAFHRVSVDEEEAARILAGKVQDVDEKTVVAGYTVSVESFLSDENGISCLTLVVENPNGVNTKNTYEGGYQGDGASAFHVSVSGDEERMLDSKFYLDTAATTETKAVYAVYLTPFDTTPVKTMNIEFVLHTEDDDSGESGKFSFPVEEVLPSQTFTDGTITAKISPLGMVCTTQSGEQGEWSLQLKDEVYSVISVVTNVNNASVSSSSQDEGTIWTAFNRLIDPQEVTAINLDGQILSVTE